MPAGGPISDGYSEWVGLIYIFNLIVGTGALTMPKAFSDAGWLLSVIGVVILAFISYLTATFMIEAMAAANALELFKKLQRYKKVSNLQEGSDDQDSAENSDRDDAVLQQIPDSNERDMVQFAGNLSDRKFSMSTLESVAESPSTDYFAINEVFEMGRMASMFYGRWGLRLFYICIAIYLYGDLAIYGTAIAKSLRDVNCDKVNGTQAEDPKTLCWSSGSVERGEAYRLFLTIFISAIAPFTFFNVQKTKYLQIFTTILRWTAFLSMITLCSVAMIGGRAKGTPPVAKPLELPTLFGVCVYSFMCHHSLPSLITPITKKKNIYALVAGDFVLILCFYNLLSLTGIFTFDVLEDTYTLNFEPTVGESIVPVFAPLQYFLALFPVVTLSTNFPIIAITLQNNLKTLILGENPRHIAIEKIGIPLLAIIPPMIISFFTEDVKILVSVTGAFAGAVIQYVIPATLVYTARRQVMLHMGIGVRNNYSSPFKNPFWITFIMVWTVICTILVSIHTVKSFIQHD